MIKVKTQQEFLEKINELYNSDSHPEEGFYNEDDGTYLSIEYNGIVYDLGNDMHYHRNHDSAYYFFNLSDRESSTPIETDVCVFIDGYYDSWTGSTFDSDIWMLGNPVKSNYFNFVESK